jgi:hypothetical protein
VTRGAPVRVMDCIGSAVIGRLCAGSVVDAKTVVVIVGGLDVVPAGTGPRLSQCMPCSAARRDRVLSDFCFVGELRVDVLVRGGRLAGFCCPVMSDLISRATVELRAAL